MKESVIQSKIMLRLKQEGAYVVKVISSSRKGVPDILACLRGQFIGIEVKTPQTRGTLTKLQQYNLDLISESKGRVAVITSIEELENFLDTL